jgi:hypothetical protein
VPDTPLSPLAKRALYELKVPIRSDGELPKLDVSQLAGRCGCEKLDLVGFWDDGALRELEKAGLVICTMSQPPTWSVWAATPAGVEFDPGGSLPIPYKPEFAAVCDKCIVGCEPASCYPTERFDSSTCVACGESIADDQTYWNVDKAVFLKLKNAKLNESPAGESPGETWLGGTLDPRDKLGPGFRIALEEAETSGVGDCISWGAESRKLWGEILRHARLASNYGMRHFAQTAGLLPSEYCEVEKTGRSTLQQLQKIVSVLKEYHSTRCQPHGDQGQIALTIPQNVHTALCDLQQRTGKDSFMQMFQSALRLYDIVLQGLADDKEVRLVSKDGKEVTLLVNL